MTAGRISRTEYQRLGFLLNRKGTDAKLTIAIIELFLYKIGLPLLGISSHVLEPSKSKVAIPTGPNLLLACFYCVSQRATHVSDLAYSQGRIRHMIVAINNCLSGRYIGCADPDGP